MHLLVLSPPGCDSSSNLAFDNLHSLKDFLLDILRNVLHWNLPDVFLMVSFLWVLRGRTQVQFFYHVLSRVHNISITSAVDVDLGHLAELAFLMFLH